MSAGSEATRRDERATLGGAVTDLDARSTAPDLSAAGDVPESVLRTDRINGSGIMEALVFGALAGRRRAAAWRELPGGPPAVNLTELGDGGLVGETPITTAALHERPSTPMRTGPVRRGR